MTVGKFYKFPNGTIVLCTAYELETFRGVVVKKGKNDKTSTYVGHYAKNWDANRNWKEVKLKITQPIIRKHG